MTTTRSEEGADTHRTGAGMAGLRSVLARPWVEIQGATSDRPRAVVVLVLIALVPLAAINAVGLAQTALWLLRHGGEGGDWANLSTLPLADPYIAQGYRWSPPAAWIWTVLVVPLGLHLWQALHLAALAAIRDWRVIALALLSWAFWQDVANGNVLILVLLTAWWALRGNAVAERSFVVLAVLIPRPLMLPVLGWLLLKRPGTRWWFLGAVVIVIGLSVISGQLDSWVARTIATGGWELSSVWNIGPSRLLGPAWIPVAIVLAGLLAWYGWLGLASVAISPYLFPYYMLMALLDVPRLFDRRRWT